MGMGNRFVELTQLNIYSLFAALRQRRAVEEFFKGAPLFLSLWLKKRGAPKEIFGQHAF
jgi:hypothetical protein